jgi:hypothetical protein
MRAHAQRPEGSRFTSRQRYDVAASGSPRTASGLCSSIAKGIGQLGTEPQGKNLRWVIPGSRLLPTDRAATLQSGSPPGAPRLAPTFFQFAL